MRANICSPPCLPRRAGLRLTLSYIVPSDMFLSDICVNSIVNSGRYNIIQR